jgi:hypothetical protein
MTQRNHLSFRQITDKKNGCKFIGCRFRVVLAPKTLYAAFILTLCDSKVIFAMAIRIIAVRVQYINSYLNHPDILNLVNKSILGQDTHKLS